MAAGIIMENVDEVSRIRITASEIVYFITLVIE